MNPKWFSPNLAYTMAKYGMSLVTLGLARDLARAGVAVNSLWPETAIATAAVGNLLGGEELMRRSRKPDIVADAAYAILTRPARACTGNFFVDVNVWRKKASRTSRSTPSTRASTPCSISFSKSRSPQVRSRRFTSANNITRARLSPEKSCKRRQAKMALET